MTQQSGGAGYPGVTSGGTGVLNVSQVLNALRVVSGSVLGAVTIDPGRVHFARNDDLVAAFVVQLADGSSGAEMLMTDFRSVPVWEIDADGSELLAAGLGRFGHAAPAAASVLSGALSAVTDAAAKAVLTSIIAALTADGGATDGTT